MKNNIVLSVFVLLTCFAIYFYSLSKNNDDTIYFYPGLFKGLFDKNGNGFHNLGQLLKEKGYKVKETKSFKHIKNAKYVVVFDIHKKKLRRIARIPKKKLILFTWEPPVVLPENHDKKYHRFFSKIYTFNDKLIDNKRYFKFYYPDARAMIQNLPSFEDKKLCCLISSDKMSKNKNEIYSKRRESIKFFEEFAPEDFDLYGYGWKKKEFSSYKGAIDNKIKTLSNYKFSICYENTENIKGYITEKIFNSFQAGCIPIYLGADNISKYIPDNCFIDKRDFKTYNELYIYLKTLTEDEYVAYLDNINIFLSSDKAKPFTPDNMIKTMKHALELKD